MDGSFFSEYDLYSTFFIFRYQTEAAEEKSFNTASILTETLTNWDVKKRYAFSLGDVEMYGKSFDTQNFELVIEMDDNERSYDYKKGLPQDLIEELEKTKQPTDHFIHELENNDIGLNISTNSIHIHGRIPNIVEFVTWFRDSFYEEYDDLLIMSWDASEQAIPGVHFFLERKTAEEMQYAILNKIKEVPELMDSDYEGED